MAARSAELYYLSNKWEQTLDDMRIVYSEFETKMQKVRVLGDILKRRIELGDLNIQYSDVSIFIHKCCQEREMEISFKTIQRSLPLKLKKRQDDLSDMLSLNNSSDVSSKLDGIDQNGNIVDFDAYTASCKTMYEVDSEEKPISSSVLENDNPKDKSFTWYDVPDYTILMELKDVVTIALSKLEDNPEHYTVVSLTEPEKDEQVIFPDMLTTLKQELDDRFDIVTKDTLRYINALGISSIRRVAERHHRFIKVTHSWSTKQISKFLKGKSRHSPINPKDTIEAMRWGYTGKECPNCRSLKWEERVNSLSDQPTSLFRCYTCGHSPDSSLTKVLRIDKRNN